MTITPTIETRVRIISRDYYDSDEYRRLSKAILSLEREPDNNIVRVY